MPFNPIGRSNNARKNRRKNTPDESAGAGRPGLQVRLSRDGWCPDRVVLLPDGKMAFVELKAPGKKPRALQRYRMKQIEDLGFRVAVLDEIEKIEPFLDELEGGKKDEV